MEQTSPTSKTQRRVHRVSSTSHGEGQTGLHKQCTQVPQMPVFHQRSLVPLSVPERDCEPMMHVSTDEKKFHGPKYGSARQNTWFLCANCNVTRGRSGPECDRNNKYDGEDEERVV
ncbi:hypothetical protein AMECASPLE_037097 [Ameca splendens]|uniref:Uncharacterized protein n=1 Tax=Ameca splendens TaxID=208324 RepID=A0ABV0Y7P4_9TELE